MAQTNVHPVVTHLYRRLYKFAWPTTRARQTGLHNMSLASYGSRDVLGDGEAWLNCVIELVRTKYLPRISPIRTPTAVLGLSLADAMMTERSFKAAAADCARVMALMPRATRRQDWTEFANDVTDLLIAFGSPGGAQIREEPGVQIKTESKKQFRYMDESGWIGIVATSKAVALDMLGSNPAPDPSLLYVKKGKTYVKA